MHEFNVSFSPVNLSCVNFIISPATRVSQVDSDKGLACNSGDIRDASSIPGLGRSSGEENGNPLQYSRLENPKDRGAWRGTVHGVAQSQTCLKRLSMHGRKNSRGVEGETSPSRHFSSLPCLMPPSSSFLQNVLLPA